MNALARMFVMAFALPLHAQDVLSIDVNKNQSSFEIVLPANPTTGFQWSVLSFDKDLLALNSSVYKGPDSALIGAGGHMSFTFGLNKKKAYPKTSLLEFKYARPWEKKSSGRIQKVVVHFVGESK